MPTPHGHEPTQESERLLRAREEPRLAVTAQHHGRLDRMPRSRVTGPDGPHVQALLAGPGAGEEPETGELSPQVLHDLQEDHGALEEQVGQRPVVLIGVPPDELRQGPECAALGQGARDDELLIELEEDRQHADLGRRRFASQTAHEGHEPSEPLQGRRLAEADGGIAQPPHPLVLLAPGSASALASSLRHGRNVARSDRASNAGRSPWLLYPEPYNAASSSKPAARSVWPGCALGMALAQAVMREVGVGP